jgi:hypothetical protein
MSSVGPLNLADADLRGFDAVDAGRYNAEVFSITMDAVKNTSGQGKMPSGTPMMKIQYRLLSDASGAAEGINNRRVFQSLVIPPADYDQSKASKMKGMIARLFIALGEPEEKVLNPSFNPDFDDYVGRPCVVVVGKEPKRTAQGDTIPDEFNNPVKGVKAAGSIGASASEGIL